MTNEAPTPALPELTFDDLAVGMRVFDLNDSRFGEILTKSEEDPEWRMIEVSWDCDDETITDVSHVLPGMHIGVEVEAPPEFVAQLHEQMGDQLAEMESDDGEPPTVVVMTLVTWE